MDALYQPYQDLTAGQRKLLCFLAYTGKKTDEQMQALYRHGEDLKADQMKKLVNSLRSFYGTSFYSYRNEYQLHAYHVAPLMLYMLDVMPQWLEHFDKFYKKNQDPQAMMLLYQLKCCIESKPVETGNRAISSRNVDILVPLASDARFLPMMKELLDIHHFVSEVLVYQVENDIADPENAIGKIADLYYSRMMPAQAKELKAIVALYDFFKQGWQIAVAKDHQCLSLGRDDWHDKYARQISCNAGSSFSTHRYGVAEGSTTCSQYAPFAPRIVTLAAAER